MAVCHSKQQTDIEEDKRRTAYYRTDLSSATDQAKNIYPKGYEIIDKYIKQLKKVEHRLNAQTKVN